MHRWEYLTLQSSKNYGTTKFYVNGEMQPALKNQEMAVVMNQLGAQGWEMVGIASESDGLTFVFKRPTATTRQLNGTASASRAAELSKKVTQPLASGSKVPNTGELRRPKKPQSNE